MCLFFMIYLYTDWASKGNPWIAWAWYVAYDENKNIIFTWSKALWIKTNNQAEYLALIEWLNKCIELKELNLAIMMDSELVIKQLNKEYKVKNPEIKKLFDQTLLLLSWMKWTATHVPRALNSKADRLANEGLHGF